jgi:hypothetical protein
MRTRQKWGIIVVLVALLFASAGVGQAMGGGHGFHGYGFHGHGFHDFRHFHRFGGPRIGIGISPFWGPYCDPYAYPYGCPPGVVAPPPVYAPPFG